METMKDRLRVMLGDERLARLEDARVLVFGCGGVGSSCIEALARGGVGTLVVVDKDVVAPSNINRQAIAFESTVGRRKVDVMAGRDPDINPGCRVFAHDAFVLAENLEALYDTCLDEAGGRINYVVDAIDTVSTKLALAALAQERGLRAHQLDGRRPATHPECLRIADVHKTVNCSLARIMRKECRKRGIRHLRVLYSCEEPVRIAAAPGAARSRTHRPGHGELHAAHHGPDARGRGPATHIGARRGRRRLGRPRDARRGAEGAGLPEKRGGRA